MELKDIINNNSNKTNSITSTMTTNKVSTVTTEAKKTTTITSEENSIKNSQEETTMTTTMVLTQIKKKAPGFLFSNVIYPFLQGFNAKLLALYSVFLIQGWKQRRKAKAEKKIHN